eukprot:TRINITY_DN7163_c0_g2_i3.p1 TRINITY_DN7163_c0_g2~~TRINITY_DN7163_c0_g2_i3.p1  ORF type:complete len:201 (+),score=40.67 TRINITY_DN7163_c0_g2_i3:53-655(+)
MGCSEGKETIPSVVRDFPTSSSKPPDYDYLFKVLLLGDSGVGKSCLLLRYADNTFTETFTATIGVDFKIKTVIIDGKTIKLQIWDTAGQEKFRTITSTYYRGAHGVILVYDITNLESFTSLNKWWSEVKHWHPNGGCQVLIVGNKSDMVAARQVSQETGQEFANEIGVPFLEASAKEDANVEKAFLKLATAIKADTVSKN